MNGRLQTTRQKTEGSLPTLSPPAASPRHSNARAITLAVAVLLLATTARAQLQQPFVYTTGGAIATRSDTTGSLTATPASPLQTLGFPVVIDAKARFFFAAGNDSIHMYQVDPVTGSYTELTGSPFASAFTNGPILLATEPTDTYLAVVNSTGLTPEKAASNPSRSTPSTNPSSPSPAP